MTDIQTQLRSLLEKDASLREKYLDPPTHLSELYRNGRTTYWIL